MESAPNLRRVSNRCRRSLFIYFLLSVVSHFLSEANAQSEINVFNGFHCKMNFRILQLHHWCRAAISHKRDVIHLEFFMPYVSEGRGLSPRSIHVNTVEKILREKQFVSG